MAGFANVEEEVVVSGEDLKAEENEPVDDDKKTKEAQTEKEEVVKNVSESKKEKAEDKK